MEGDLKLVGAIFSKKKYFRIDANRLVLYDKRQDKTAKDFVLLESGLATVEMHNSGKKPHCMKVIFKQHKNSKTWVLQCQSDQERQQWIDAMQKCIETSAQRIASRTSKKVHTTAESSSTNSSAVKVVGDVADHNLDMDKIRELTEKARQEEQTRAVVVKNSDQDDGSDSDDSEDSDGRNRPYLPSDTSSEDEDSVFEGAERSDDEDNIGNDGTQVGGPPQDGGTARREFSTMEQAIEQLEQFQTDEKACHAACSYLNEQHLQSEDGRKTVGATVLRRESLQSLLNIAAKFNSNVSIVFVVLRCLQLAMEEDTTEKSRTLLRLVRGIATVSSILKTVHGLPAEELRKADQPQTAATEAKNDKKKNDPTTNGYDSDEELEDADAQLRVPVPAHARAITDCTFILKQLLSRKTAFSTEFIRDGTFTTVIEIAQAHVEVTYLLAIEFVELATNLCNCDATLALPAMRDRGGNDVIASAIKQYPLLVDKIIMRCVKYTSLLLKDEDKERFGQTLAKGGAVEELVCRTLPRFFKKPRLQQIVYKFFQQLGHSVSLYQSLARDVFDKHSNEMECILNGAILLGHLASSVNAQTIADANIMKSCLKVLSIYMEKQGWVVKHILSFLLVAMQHNGKNNDGKTQMDTFAESDGYPHLFSVISVYGSNDEMLQLCMDVLDVLVNGSDSSFKPLYTQYLVKSVESLLRLIESSDLKKELLRQELELLSAITYRADLDESAINEQLRTDLISFMFDIVKKNKEGQRDVLHHALKVLLNVTERFEPFGLEESEVRLLFWVIEKNIDLEECRSDDEEFVAIVLELCGQLGKMHHNRDLMIKHQMTFRFRAILDLHKSDRITEASETIKTSLGL